MNRRFFIRNTLSVSILSSLMLTGVLRKYMHPSPDIKKDPYDGRVLVLIQLDGGNDGLNTVIPLDQYTNLAKARKNILIPDPKVLRLHDCAISGLHPSLPDLQRIYNDKQLTIIQGVGCPNPDLSHFKAIDIWHTGSDSSANVSTGWLGRYIEQGQHTGHLQNSITDPPAVQIGAALSKALQGAGRNVGMVVRNTDFFYELALGSYAPAPDTAGGHQLSFVRETMEESKKYLLKVKSAAGAQKNLSKLYPSANENSLADQLKIVAQLIGGGLQTKVYIVKFGGFDTHDKQVEFSDPTKGDHADLLSKLSSAIAAFEDDLHLMGKQDNVIGMVYSEFGRRIKSNSGYGCDHGTTAPVILFGSKLKGGLIGHNPPIQSKITVNDNLPLQNDFRSVYASVLNGWFSTPEHELNSVLMGSYPMLDLFR